MASNFNNLLVALFFTAVASASVSHGVIFDGSQINVVEALAVGRLTCILSSNPLINATVAIDCGGGSFTVGKTDLNGQVSVYYLTNDSLMLDTSSCNATITLGNALSCLEYPLTSTTSVSLILLSIAETVVGQVATFAVLFPLSLLGL